MTASGAARRRTRLARGPLTIGQPAPALEARLADSEVYRPDTIADGGSAFGLTVRAASVRGLAKRYAGGPRQDDLCLRTHEPSATVVVAVADGVSAATRSDLGAALAVRYATAAVLRQLDHGAGSLEWPDVFEQAAWALVEEHRRYGGEAQATAEDAAAMLATTLLVATVTAAGAGEKPEGDGAGVQVAAVGDSPAFRLTGRVFQLLVGETETDRGDGLIGGGVAALPRAPRPVIAERGRLAAGEVLLLCTDGLSLPLASGDGEVGRTLARELAHPPDVVDFARLLDFSRSTYDDDRTLVAIWV